MFLVGAVAAEIVVALALDQVRMLALVHAAALFAYGMYAVLKQHLALLICVLAYVAGSEVLWRQVRAPVFYLAAPYMVTLLSAFAVVFVLRRLGRDGRLAVLYAALMLPASVATIRTAGEGARELVAFALSGPLALAALVAFTSQVKVKPWLYRRVLWVTLIACLGPLTIAVSNIRAELAVRASIQFKGQSNFVTSGGFGPVQVSSVLSLGMLAAILLVICERDKVARTLAGFAAVVLGIQTLLTFSRGGSFSVGIAVAALAIAQARNRRVRNGIVAVAAIALLLAHFLIFPWLEDFTDGEFQSRFSDTESARTDLAANDTAIFREHFMFGVGPGMTKYQRLGYEVCQVRSDGCKDESSSHTEFTRMLGEHGIPGVISIALFALLAYRAYRRAGPGRAFTVAWLAWTIAQMFYANLRIVAVPFAFGLAFLTLESDPTADPVAPEDADDDAPPPPPTEAPRPAPERRHPGPSVSAALLVQGTPNSPAPPPFRGEPGRGE